MSSPGRQPRSAPAQRSPCPRAGGASGRAAGRLGRSGAVLDSPRRTPRYHGWSGSTGRPSSWEKPRCGRHRTPRLPRRRRPRCRTPVRCRCDGSRRRVRGRHSLSRSRCPSPRFRTRVREPTRHTGFRTPSRSLLRQSYHDSSSARIKGVLIQGGGPQRCSGSSPAVPGDCAPVTGVDSPPVDRRVSAPPVHVSGSRILSLTCSTERYRTSQLSLSTAEILFAVVKPVFVSSKRAPLALITLLSKAQ